MKLKKNQSKKWIRSKKKKAIKRTWTNLAKNKMKYYDVKARQSKLA